MNSVVSMTGREQRPSDEHRILFKNMPLKQKNDLLD